MDLIIKINLDNAAFEDDLGTEVANILEKLVARFWGVLVHQTLVGRIRDTNGNTIGTVEVAE